MPDLLWLTQLDGFQISGLASRLIWNDGSKIPEGAALAASLKTTETPQKEKDLTPFEVKSLISLVPER